MADNELDKLEARTLIDDVFRQGAWLTAGNVFRYRVLFLLGAPGAESTFSQAYKDG